MTKPKWAPSQLVSGHLDRAIDLAWGYCREHKDSLDSETACLHIRSAFEEAAFAICEENAELYEQIAGLKVTLREQRKTIGMLKLDLAEGMTQ